MRFILVIGLMLSSGFAVVDEMGNVGPAGPTPVTPAAGPNLPELNWEARQPMPTARYGMAVAATGGLLYAVGGYSGTRLTTNERYDPAGDTWSTQTPMANARNGCCGHLFYEVRFFSVTFVGSAPVFTSGNGDYGSECPVDPGSAGDLVRRFVV